MLKRLKRSAKHAWRYVTKHKIKTLLYCMGAYFILMGGLFLWAASLPLPDLNSLSQIRVDQSVKLYDRTGQVLLYDLSNKNIQRTSITLEQVSPNIQNAIIAIEDPNFYTHHGVEFRAIARAIWVDITHVGLSQGGSTITQQVIKNTILTSDKSLVRKLKEWILALKMERVLNKQQIFTLYLNQIPFGGTKYGVEEASQSFFNKHASQVDVAEGAYLAAVMPAPSYYSPYGYHKDALDARKNLVLNIMYQHGYISAEERDAAKAQVVTFTPPRATSIQAPHFVFYVQQYLEQKYGEYTLQTSGWKVTTTLDAELQAKGEEIISAGALSNTTKFNASNAGLIALDPQSGQILTMVGSRNYFDDEIDGAYNITLAERQPGSAFKPFAYAQAFSEGYTPETVLWDIPTQFSTSCSPSDVYNNKPPCYAPQNYDDKFRGPMTLRDAIAQSINIPSIKALYLAGISNTLQLAKSMGISTLGNSNQYGLTLVLGGGEVTLLEMSSAYGTFATDGTHYQPTAVLKIEDASGNVIEDNSQTAGTQVLQPVVAEQINDILSDAVARGPLGNTQLSFSGYDVAVKTGTTNDYRDAWTIGYTPNLVVGMWAGNNDNTSMTHNVSGYIVGPMWHNFMAYALPTRPTEYFTRASVDESGMKPVLRGTWQVPGSDGSLHEILYWLNKNDPQGSTPPSSNDSQYTAWETGLQIWLARNGYPAGYITTPVVQTTPSSGTGTATTPPQGSQQMMPVGPATQ